MKSAAPSASLPFTLGAIVTGILALSWLWHGLCVFPAHTWNELRLAPAFQFVQGQTVYAPDGSGPVSTWIYGPLPFLLLLPATFAPSASAALLTAGCLNFFIIAGTLLVCVLKLPALAPLGFGPRLAAWFGCLACWPTHSLHYLQADTSAIALGLIGNLVILLHSTQSRHLWFGALAAASAVACKQTALEAAAAQVVWLGLLHGWRAAATHVGRLAFCGGAWAAWMVTTFDAHALWFNLVVVPGNLPWKDFLSRLSEHRTVLLPQLVLPVLFFIFVRKPLLRRDSPLLLPALTWMFSLFPGMSGFFKIGGSVNSLHGLQYLLPGALLWIMQPAVATRQIRTTASSLVIMSGLLFGTRLATVPQPVWQPVTEHLDQGAFLARSLPGEIWFPWNPLVTYYAEKRFDHTEDGLETRRLAQRGLAPAAIAAHLPPRWHATAILTFSHYDWQLARSFSPVTAKATSFGSWEVLSWEPTASPALLP